MARLLLCLLWVGTCTASSLEALSKVPVVSGLASQLGIVFPEVPELAVKKAVAAGLVQALGDEGADLHDVTCNRDYSRLCPEGWADAGDGNACLAPQSYQGPCAAKLELGGQTAQQKKQLAARCGASYGCLGACASDASQTCPLGWREDVNHDCLAPVGYSGRCVGRKNFRGMKQSEKQQWAKSCDVTWPCRKALGDAAATESASAPGVFNNDCVPNYAGACPEHFTQEADRCMAPQGFSGRCGFSVSSQYTPAEKTAYAEACLTPWPCSTA